MTNWLEQNDPDVYFGHVTHTRRIQRMLEMLEDVSGKVIDIGPFAGVLSEKIIAQGNKEVYGVDAHEDALRMAARRGVLPVVADVEDEGIGCEDETFDAAVMGDVLGYILDPDFVLGEIRRVLKPGAKFVLSVPNLVSLGNRLLALLGSGPYDVDVRPYGGGYQRSYTRGSLQLILEANGFIVERLEANHVHLPLYRMPLTARFFGAPSGISRPRWLYCHWLARILPQLGEDFIVLARKPARA